jgi:hypothetical protein
VVKYIIRKFCQFFQGKNLTLRSANLIPIEGNDEKK